MGEFFNGWRRKAGLVTLAMACVLAGGWMRSYVIEDEFIWRSQTLAYFLKSANGRINYETNSNESVVKDVYSLAFPTGWRRWPGVLYEPADPSDEPGDIFDDLVVESRWRWGGFDFGTAVSSFFSMRLSIWIVPYWSLVLPLTLLSAWLILIKPRKAKGTPQISTHVWVRTANRTATSETFSR